MPNDSYPFRKVKYQKNFLIHKMTEINISNIYLRVLSMKVKMNVVGTISFCHPTISWLTILTKGINAKTKWFMAQSADFELFQKMAIFIIWKSYLLLEENLNNPFVIFLFSFSREECVLYQFIKME